MEDHVICLYIFEKMILVCRGASHAFLIALWVPSKTKALFAKWCKEGFWTMKQGR
jgi:hypothetical protein